MRCAASEITFELQNFHICNPYVFSISAACNQASVWDLREVIRRRDVSAKLNKFGITSKYVEWQT